MLQFVLNNPYRILGICTNAPIHEKIANSNRLNAYLKVGKTVTFPLDLPQILPAINRTIQDINTANSNINLPKDHLKYALFWFLKNSAIDNMALEYLQNGNEAKALELFSKKESFSSLINKGVLAFIQDDLNIAVECITKVIHTEEYLMPFVETVCGSNYKISEDEVAQMFMDSLISEVSISTLVEVFQEYGAAAKDDDYLKDKYVNELISNIDTAIALVEDIDRNDAIAQYRGGENLMKKTNDDFSSLRATLGKDDEQYQMVADKLAKHILQCGINYYNSSDDDVSTKIDKAFRLQSYASSIAEGKLTKDRCKQNTDILQDIKQKLPPQTVINEVAAINSELAKYCKLPDKICYAITLLNNTKSYLISIKNKLGVNNAYYLRMSTLVVGNAQHNIIEEVNQAQNDFTMKLEHGSASPSDIFSLLGTVNSAWNATLKMDGFDMEYDYKISYNQNRNTLAGLRNQLNSISSRTTHTSSPPPSSGGDGCYIATMVYGDYDHPQVMELRRFRDRVLKKSFYGRAFIRFYYRYSPSWVEHMKDKKMINDIIRVILDKFIKLYKYENK